MIQLMKSEIKNESFIVISENLSFKEFQTKVAKALGTIPAKKEAGRFLLGIGWRLDWLNHKLFGKRRKLSKQLAKTALSKTIYNASKIKTALNLDFKSMDLSINAVCKYFLNELKEK
ncbi:MAG: NAD-dependent epimerase, partial [Aquaticitalea sp.]